MRKVLLALCLLPLGGILLGCGEGSSHIPVGLNGVWFCEEQGEPGLNPKQIYLTFDGHRYSLTVLADGGSTSTHEKGQIYYNLKDSTATLTVKSTSVLDWTTGQPREMPSGDERPAYQYTIWWRQNGDQLSLGGDIVSSRVFSRVKRSGETPPR